MMSRGLFCISGIRTYQKVANLDGVTEEIRTVRRALGALGLTELFPFSTPERSHDDLEDELREWAESAHDTPRDDDSENEERLLIYCTGHGSVVDTRFRLVLASGRPYQTDALLTALTARKSLRQVVLILDACFSEPGVDDALREMRRPNTRTSQMEFWGIGSSRRLEVAPQKTFASAFATVLASKSRPSWSISHFEPGAVAAEVNASLSGSQTVWLAEGHSATACRVLPNPCWQPATPPADLPIPADWAAAARGVSAASRPGFFFTGRENELRALREHVKGETAEQIFVVRGGAGSGKSALLGHFVLMSVARDVLPMDVRLRWPGSSTRVIACRGTRDSVLRGLARRLDLVGQRLDDIVRVLHESTGRTTIVLDQLAEADDQSWDDVLTALAEVNGVRLVLGLPSHSGIRVSTPHWVTDLDLLGDRTDTDVREYLSLRLRLTQQEATRSLTASHSKWGLHFKIAVAAADAYTDAVAQGLRTAEAESRAERAAAGAARRVCRTILHSYLGERAGVVVDALCALCSYDDMIVVPAHEWAAAASDPSGVLVTADDVTTAAARLGSLVECRPGAGGLPRWRPRFKARVSADSAPSERFLARLPQVNSPSEVDWSMIDPAVRTLVAFAASLDTPRGRMLDDPGFLLDAPPSLVSAAVRRLRNDSQGRMRRSLVARAVPPNETAANRALILDIAARRYGVKLRPVASWPPRHRPTREVSWVQPDRPRTARFTRLSAAQAGDVAVTIDDSDALDFWSLTDGRAIRSTVQVEGVPRTVTVASVAGVVLALVTTWQGEIWSIDCHSDEHPVRRPELVPTTAGGTKPAELLASLHPSGQVVVGLGADVWVTDLTSGNQVRRAVSLDSDLHSILTVGPTEGPSAWLVTNSGRIRRLWLGSTPEFDLTQLPTPRRPLIATASPDGERVLVVDVGGQVHLRSSSGDGDLLDGGRLQNICTAAVDNRSVVVAGGPARGPGWLIAHDITGRTPMFATPLDEAAIGVALPETGQAVIGRPAGLLKLELRDRNLPPRGDRPASTDQEAKR
ncbi:ATP-binding protein [Amycolatopsis sp. QT-25]|uniref:ATP-binding protein n=1 Tax=Amycolatopsis sp. QT-25 TaxID=3034022 RepID=UPI0023EAA3FE|nr:ATP-binding protein [Amycolatopsis sp. QT-25]WET81086.1 ATP-binding protein [Amycolatopsis sp. QT-25]